MSPDKDNETPTFDYPSKQSKKRKNKMKRVDSFGLPLVGTDDKPIKMLRCGHIFDLSCWTTWVDAGAGDPFKCPVCRQDVGRPKRRPPDRGDQAEDQTEGGGAVRRERVNPEQSWLFSRVVTTTTGPSILANYHTFQSQQRQRRGGGGPFAPLTHPTLHRLRIPVLGAVTPPHSAEGLDEQTPLFERAAASSEENDY